MVGTSDQVIEKIHAFTNNYSCTNLVVYVQFPSVNIIKVNRSIEIFTKKDIPLFSS
jgi:hypothetical protein